MTARTVERLPVFVGRVTLATGAAHGVAPQSSSPEVAKGGAGLLVGVTVMDGATGLALRRGGS